MLPKQNQSLGDRVSAIQLRSNRIIDIYENCIPVDGDNIINQYAHYTCNNATISGYFEEYITSIVSTMSYYSGPMADKPYEYYARSYQLFSNYPLLPDIIDNTSYTVATIEEMQSINDKEMMLIKEIISKAEEKDSFVIPILIILNEEQIQALDEFEIKIDKMIYKIEQMCAYSRKMLDHLSNEISDYEELLGASLDPII